MVEADLERTMLSASKVTNRRAFSLSRAARGSVMKYVLKSLPIYAKRQKAVHNRISI